MNDKDILIHKLKAEHRFWSYNDSSVNDVPDNMLIEKVMVYLDLDDINRLFTIYGYKKVKKVWLEKLVPQGDYYFQLNRFLAWYYFKAKKPDAYVKSMATRHLNKLLCVPTKSRKQADGFYDIEIIFEQV